MEGAQSVDSRSPLGGGDRLHEGAEPRRARVRAHATRRRSTCSTRSWSGRSSATATSGFTSHAEAPRRKAPSRRHSRMSHSKSPARRTKQPHDAHLMPLDPGRHWLEAGITGIPRQREWDAVKLVEAPGATGDELEFVALPDGRVLLESGPVGFDPAPLVDGFPRSDRASVPRSRTAAARALGGRRPRYQDSRAPARPAGRCARSRAERGRAPGSRGRHALGSTAPRARGPRPRALRLVRRPSPEARRLAVRGRGRAAVTEPVP